MKIREKIHRILAGLLAVVVLTTSLSLDSLAQTVTEPTNGTMEISTEVPAAETEEKSEAEAGETETPENPGEAETPETPEETDTPETPVNPEETETPETPENPEETEMPETPENPEEKETPEIPAEETENENLEDDKVYVLSGKIYEDFDGDGQQGEYEEGISELEVKAYLEGEEEAAASVYTDENGVYTLEGLKAGSYRLDVYCKEEYIGNIYDLEKSAAASKEEVVLPSEDDIWFFRYPEIKLSEDMELEFGFQLGDYDSPLGEEMKLLASESPARWIGYLHSARLTYGSHLLTERVVKVQNGAVLNRRGVFYEYDVAEPGRRLFCLQRGLHVENQNTGLPVGHTGLSNEEEWDIYCGGSDNRKYCQRVAYFAEDWPGWNFDAKTAQYDRVIYHVAAQLLIWNRMSPLPAGQKFDIGYTSGDWVSLSSQIEAAMANISAQVEKFGKAPSFCAVDQEVVRKDGRKITLTDDNGVLSGYTITQVDEEGIESAQIIGNSLVITMKKGAAYNNKSYKVNLARVSSGGGANALFVATGYQNIMRSSNPSKEAHVTVKNKDVGTVRIRKVDDNGDPVRGVTFLYGSSQKKMNKKSGPTDADGFVEIEYPIPTTGSVTVYVKEDEVPDRMFKDKTVKEVTLKVGEKEPIRFENPLKRRVRLKKVDTSGNPVEGAVFEYHVEGHKTIHTGITDKNGEFKSDRIFKAGMKIIMTEKSTSFEHKLPADESQRTQTLVLSTDSSKNVFKFTNDTFGIGLKLTKYNRETGKRVKGMVFRIGTDPTLTDPAKYKDYTTDRDGVAQSDRITYKKGMDYIYYREVSGPPNIKLDPTIKSVIVHPSFGTFTHDQIYERSAYNEEAPVPIKVKKTGSDGRLLDRVSFNVERYSSGKWQYVESITTVAGYAVTKTEFLRSDIRDGNVRFKETSLGNNPGYELLKEPVVVTKTLADAEVDVIEFEIDNPKIPTELEIYKYDKDSDANNRKPLKGAIFRITDAKGKEVIPQLVTGADGIARTTELYADTPYYLEEIQPPRGYKRIDDLNGNPKKKYFKLTKDSKVVTCDENGNTIEEDKLNGGSYKNRFNIPNDPIYGYIEVYKTDGNERALPGIEFTIYKDGIPVGSPLITDQTGYAKSGKLLADGEYMIQETYCPPQYIQRVGMTLTFDFLYPKGDGSINGWTWSFNKDTMTLTYSVVNPELLGTVTVHKVDSENRDIKVPGATIELHNRYTSELIGTQTTNENGEAVFTNVPVVNPNVSPFQGHYYVEEITGGDNHVLPLNTRYYFSVTVDHPNVSPTEDVPLENPPVRGNIEITKVDEDHTKKLEGAEFAVYEKKAYEQAVANHTVPTAVASGSTDGNGKLTFNLRYGDYIIKETKASKYHFIDLENGGLVGNPEGVTYDKEVQGYRVTISEHGKTIPFTVENGRLIIPIKVTKYGYEKTLPNVKFNICKADGEVLDQIKTGVDGTVISKEFYAEELGEGAYVIEAEEVPNYLPNENKYLIDVESKTNTKVELKSITVTNERAPINLKLLKVNTEGEKVAADFNIRAYTPYYMTQEYEYDNHTYSTTSSDNVINLSGLLELIDYRYKTYAPPEAIERDVIIEITETATEAPYIKKEGIIAKFYYRPWIDGASSLTLQSIQADSGVTYDEKTLTLTVVNEPIPISLNIVKLQSASSNYLPGAVFSIKPEGIDMDPIIVESVGTSEGVLVKDLPYAESYLITEEKAPEGYVKVAPETIYLSDFAAETNSAGNIISYNKKLQFEDYKGFLRIKKVGSDGKPVDATFDVYGFLTNDTHVPPNMYNCTVQTSKEDGYGTVDLETFIHHSPGSGSARLTINESKVNSNYLLSSESIVVVVNWDRYRGVTFECTPSSSNFRVEKTDDNSITIIATNQRKQTDFYLKKKGLRDDYVEAGIKLEAVNLLNGNSKSPESYTINTNTNVKTSFFDSLTSAGGYEVYITEEKVSVGYKKLPQFKAFTYYPDKEGAEKFQDVNKCIKIESTIGDEKNSFTITLENEPLPVRLLVKKIDKETKEPLAGAEIQVTSSNGVIKTITTSGSEEGDWVEDLPYAAYYTITETKAPDGYERLTSSEKVTIDQFTERTVNGETIGYEYKRGVTLENPKKFEFYILKRDSFGYPAEASFSVEMYSGTIDKTFTESVDTVGGKADLTPVLEKGREEGNISWRVTIKETWTENGLIKYEGIIAQFYFHPENIYAGSKDFVQYHNANSIIKAEDVVYGDATKGYASAHFTLKNENIPINLTVIKKEEGSNPVKYLAGAEFEISMVGGEKNMEPIKVTTTDSLSGETVPLPYAESYTVRETKAPLGYKLDETVHTYSLDNFEKTIDNETITAYNLKVERTNDPVKGNVAIYKYDKADPSNLEKKKQMAGAQFEIYKGTLPTEGTDKEKYDKVTAGADYVFVNTVTIGADGTGTYEDLPYGTYVIKETVAPANYELSYELKEVTIQKENQTVEVSFGEDRKEGSLTIYKWDDSTPRKPLAGAEFQVYENETDKAVGDKLVTGLDGRAGPVSLPYGSYYIKEVKAPRGYIILEGNWDQPFEINASHPNEEKNVFNKKATYELKLIKQDDKGGYLAGARFGVFADEEKPLRWPDPENALYTIDIGTSGVAIQPLEEPGDYDIYELKAPNGYELITKKVADVHVDTDTPTAEVIVKNQPQMIPLKIIKLDEKTRTPLAGAKFEIHYNGELVATTEATDSNGEVTVQVPAGDGTYTVKEITAPGAPGEYVLDSTPREVTLTSTTDAQGVVTYEAERLTITNVKTESGTVLLTKTDSETGEPVAGAVYTVYNSEHEAVGTLTTESNGQAQLSNLAFGIYTVEETTIPEGYETGTIDPKEFTLSSTSTEKVVKITATDSPLKNGFKVKKVDVTNSETMLAGAEFKVFASWDDAYNYDLKAENNTGVLATAVSGESGDNLGIAVFENLRYGTYYVRETKAPTGYMLTDEIKEVTVNENSQDDVYTIVYEDYPQEGGFKVRKTDKDTGRTLAGAEFKVEKKISETEVQLIDTYTTGEDGTFETASLDFGTYLVTETKAPEGYRRSDPVTQEVEINEETWNRDLTVTFANERIQIPITVHKVDNEGNPLAGARFAIYKLNAEGKREGDPVAPDLVTGSDGSATSIMLPPGTYELVEVSAPRGYDIVSPTVPNHLKVTINETTKAEDAERTVVNNPITGKLRIEKIDKKTQQGMNDVVFPVYRVDNEGNEIFYKNATTTTVDGVDGIAILEGIPYGTYRVKETVPKGYVDEKINEVFQIGSKPEEREALIKVENTPIIGSFTLVKVDADDPGKAVPGAVYRVYAELNADGTVNEDSHMKGYDVTTLPDTLVPETTENGEVIPEHLVHTPAEPEKELRCGTYYVKEFTSPPGYMLNKTIYTVEITEDQRLVEIVAKDTKYTGSVTVHKKDQYDNPVEGAVFAVYTQDDYNNLNTDASIKPMYMPATDEYGNATLEGLALEETYVIVEDSAPDGYEKDEDFYEEFKPTLDELTFTFECTNKKKDEIIIKKVDEEGNPLIVAFFSLYSVGQDGIAQSADDVQRGDPFANGASSAGIARYDTAMLPNGTYYVREIQAPEGGYILSDEIIEFEITDEKRSYEFVFENQPYEAELELWKVDEENQPLTGAEFELYETRQVQDAATGVWNVEETFKQKIDLDENAHGKVVDLKANRSYLIRETKAPDGYQKIEDIHFNFIDEGVKRTEKDRTYYYYATTVTNEPIKGKILIHKAVSNETAAEAEFSLAGAEFTITNKAGEQVGEKLVTGEDGTVISGELPGGVYTITETKAPEGTVLNKEIGTVNIDGTEIDRVYEYTHTNTIPTGTIQIVKKDQNGVLLEGAEFEILQHGTKLVDKLTTTENGRAKSKELPYGTYLIRETKAPVGHKFGETTEWIREINATATTIEIEVENPTTDGGGQGIRVVKYDKDNPNIHLQGAKFDLYTEAGWNDTEYRVPIESGLTTDADGELNIDLKEAGTYVLVETQAPSQYVLDATPHIFTVGKTQFISLHIPNAKPQGRMEFIKTGTMLTGMEENTSYPGLKNLLWDDAGNVKDAEISVYATTALQWNGKAYADGDLLFTLKSGEVSDYLPVGTYEYQETSAPSEYIMDTGRHTIEVVEETTAEAKPVKAPLTNVHAKATLELYKAFEDQLSLTEEEIRERFTAVKFGVYTAEDIVRNDVTIPATTLVAVFGVDDTGKSVWTTQPLPEGAYYVREIETADGYLLDEESHSFTLKYDHADTVIQLSTLDKPIVNELVYGRIHISKVGPGFTAVNSVTGPNKWPINLPMYSDVNLVGAEFEIRTKQQVTIGGVLRAPGAVVDTVISGEEATSIPLPLGTYEVVETKAPEGYVITTKPQTVVLTQSTEPHEITIEEVRVTNTKASVELQVYKQFFGLSDEEAKDLYPQVYFGVFADEMISGMAETAVLNKNMLVYPIQIGPDGTGKLPEMTHLPAGNYYLKELSTADGYAVSEKKYPFTIEPDSQGTIIIEGISKDNPVVNIPEDSTGFAFRKIDEENNPLEGAVFTLYMCKNKDEGHTHSELAGTDESCWEEIGKGLSKTSGADGIVDFGKLPNGDYQLKETKAPKGFERPQGQWRIHVDSKAAVNHITIEACGENTPPAFRKAEDTAAYQYQLPNHRRTDLPLTGGLGLFPYMGGGSVLLSAASLLLKKRRKEESEEE